MRSDGEGKEDADDLFSVVSKDRTKGSGHKVEHANSHLSITDTFYCGTGKILAKVAQKGCGVFILIQNSAGHGPVQWLWLSLTEQRDR